MLRRKAPAPKPSPNGRHDTLLGLSTSMAGTLQVPGHVRLEGVFEGHIEAGGNVIVGQGARVVADIVGRDVVVHGAVLGNVTASGRLDISPTGGVWGDVTAQSMVVDEGGVLHGQSTMLREPPPQSLLLAAPLENEERET
ncbi:MAG: polymer-forming cytoskeletal protein [Chloroflexi bacterium]|nr:polymer-forming cytoskeletal protein [Chloroflexota bacterium]MBU1752217.1 polymer-forming cytoskeletal protein [Chloroflexota bacterium]MBU1879020.1 polymer-forming cytoskeletal protein [Chloroflexota bacterium]